MKPPALVRKTLFVAALLCVTVLTSNANLVADPGFEASADGLGPHPFSAAWTNVDASGFSGVGGDSAFAHSGDNYAFLGATPNFGSLSQSFATTTGTTYTFSFWLANDATAGLNQTNSFSALWNGMTIFNLTNAPVFGYTQYSFSEVATGPITSIEFVYRHDNDFFRLDDVSVAVPEPGSTIWLALPIFAGLGLLHFRLGRAKGLAGV